MFNITVKVKPDNSTSPKGTLIITVDDGHETRIIPTHIKCTPPEIHLYHMKETVHIVKHLYSVVEDFHNCGMSLAADEIVRCFRDTYNPDYDPHVLERFITDDKIAEIRFIMC